MNGNKTYQKELQKVAHKEYLKELISADVVEMAEQGKKHITKEEFEELYKKNKKLMKETLKKRKELELVAKKALQKEYVKQFVLSTLLELKNEKKREAFIKDLVKSDVLEYSVKNKIDLNNKQDIKKVKNFMNLKLKEHNDKIASLVINPQMLEAMKEGYKTLLKDTEFLEQQKMKAQKQHDVSKKSGLNFDKAKKEIGGDVKQNTADISTHILDQEFGI